MFKEMFIFGRKPVGSDTVSLLCHVSCILAYSQEPEIRSEMHVKVAQIDYPIRQARLIG